MPVSCINTYNYVHNSQLMTKKIIILYSINAGMVLNLLHCRGWYISITALLRIVTHEHLLIAVPAVASRLIIQGRSVPPHRCHQTQKHDICLLKIVMKEDCAHILAGWSMLWDTHHSVLCIYFGQTRCKSPVIISYTCVHELRINGINSG